MLEFELVLPCYNEGDSIEALLKRACAAAESAGYDSTRFQLVLVDNGSRDHSQSVFQKLKTSELGSWFRSVHVEVNQGYGFGLSTGLKTATAKYVAWSHADQQCDPKDAFKALDVLKSSDPKTLVKGVRFGRNWKDVCVSRVFEFFARLFLGLKVYEVNAQPKVFPKELLKEIKNPPKTFAFDLYVLYVAARAGYQTKTIDVLFPPRVHGVSRWASTFIGRYKTIWGMLKYMRTLSQTEGRLS